MIAEDDKRLSFVPLEQATVPPAGLIRHIKDHWWCVHPTKGLIFFRKESPQANSNEAVGKHFIANMYPWAELKFVPSVFLHIDPRDYI